MSRRLFGTPSRNTSRNFSRKLAAEIAKQMITAIPSMMVQLQQSLSTAPAPPPETTNLVEIKAPTCSCKHCNSSDPLGHAALKVSLQFAAPNNHDKTGTSTRESPKKSSKETSTTSATKPNVETPTRSSKRKRKARNQNLAASTPAALIMPTPPFTPIRPPSKRPYNGTLPQCDTCKFHHASTVPCRLCTHCGYYGHVNDTCRQLTQLPAQPVVQQNTPPVPPTRVCYHCGSPDHLRNTCPRLIQINPGRAAIADQTQDNNEVENAAV